VEAARVVEVLHDRGDTVSPRWLLGSGFVVRSDVVITAAHNLEDSDISPSEKTTVVRTLEGVEYDARLIAHSKALDLALLAVPKLQATPVKIGRIDRERVEVLRDVMAVGFPNYKYANDRPPALKRQPAQPVGSVPTVEGVSAGYLTLKIEAGEPAPAKEKNSSPWEGLSGAGVFATGCLFGIVVEHNLAEGLSTLTLVPLSRIIDLPGTDGATFRAILGLDDAQTLIVVGGNAEDEGTDDPVLLTIIKDLQDVMKLGERGLLTPAEVSALKLTAYKEAKGWR